MICRQCAHTVDGNRLAKSDAKLKNVFGAILIGATLLGINALASALHTPNDGAPPVPVSDTVVGQ
jgi:hypothetical protein